MPRSLYLKSLKLRNFKGIAELDLAFDESLTLLAGVNGVGKTTVMQALLAVVTSAWWWKSPHRLPLFRIAAGVTHSATCRPEAVLELGALGQPSIEVRFEVSDPNPKEIIRKG